ncbi:MAG: carboxymethylenebutenolidase [Gaiellaceae bacterium]|nr:carboxymethylenebutenolidase [Gaiellaceae bacterium]
MTDIATPDGVADAYRTGEGPAVLFIMDAFGLRPRIEEMADRIAARGYTVLAPNVFYRAGRAPVLPMPDFTEPDGRAAFFEQVRPLMEQLGGDEWLRDGAAYLDQLTGPVAITGYCMGARLGLRLAAAFGDRVVALGGFHGGRLVGAGAGDIRGELYFGHADNDASMPAEAIAALDRALDEAGVTHTTEVYAGAAHGYTMADTAAYDEAACERHFAALFALLDRAF